MGISIPLRVLILTAALTAALPAVAGADSTSDALEAAIVYNFARFSEWPESRFADSRAPVVLCISPQESIAPQLAALEGKPVGARSLHVRVSGTSGRDCHMAFISRQDSSASNLSALSRRGVLVVGDAPGFSNNGAIGLVTFGRQIRFEVNLASAQAAGVRLSSQLLRLATSVR